MSIHRRSFLKGAGLGAGAAVVAAAGLTPVAASAEDIVQHSDSDSLAAVPFYGPHQNGVLDDPPAAAVFVVFDCLAKDKAELTKMFQTITTLSAELCQGEKLPVQESKAPPPDNNLLGPDPVADGLTITFGLGATMFDGRYGLAPLKPTGLTTMPVFPNDNLNPAETGGDILLQICGGQYDAVIRAMRLIMRATRGQLQIKYRIDGFMSQPRPSGSPRNMMGFKDGTSQPPVKADPQVAADLLWIGDDQPAWAAGGTFIVFRIIKILVEFWDRIGIPEQEGLIGRQRDSGAPLDGAQEIDVPDFAGDANGEITPLDSHIRLANPHTPETDASRILRRGYNYDRGTELNGDLDQGLIFVCFQRNIQTQFEATQNRLADEGLVDYITPTGGGYFVGLPGVTGPDDYFAKTLLTAN